MEANTWCTVQTIGPVNNDVSPAHTTEGSHEPAGTGAGVVVTCSSSVVTVASVAVAAVAVVPSKSEQMATVAASNSFAQYA